jgi:hypothetical protein
MIFSGPGAIKSWFHGQIDVAPSAIEDEARPQCACAQTGSREQSRAERARAAAAGSQSSQSQMGV